MYLITGVTGNVGREVVEQLLARYERVRVFVREAAKAGAWGDRVEVAVGDFTQPETFARAVAGTAGVFLMNGRLDAPTIQALLAATRPQAGQRLVFQSSVLAQDLTSPIGQMHREQEAAVRAAGWRGAVVRPGAFMTNAYQWRTSIRAEGVVYNATGTGRYAPIAAEDIAAVAVAALTKLEVNDEVIEITGGELLTLAEQVEILATSLGRPLRCVEISIETAVENMVRAGFPPRMAAAVAQSYAAVREGRAARLTDTVLKLTGAAPMTFGAWARRHAADFA